MARLHLLQPATEILPDGGRLNLQTRKNPFSSRPLQFLFEFVERRFLERELSLFGSSDRPERSLDDRFKNPVTALDPRLDAQGRYRCD
jgi:hypothetical protein